MKISIEDFNDESSALRVELAEVRNDLGAIIEQVNSYRRTLKQLEQKFAPLELVSAEYLAKQKIIDEPLLKTLGIERAPYQYSKCKHTLNDFLDYGPLSVRLTNILIGTFGETRITLVHLLTMTKRDVMSFKRMGRLSYSELEDFVQDHFNHQCIHIHRSLTFG